MIRLPANQSEAAAVYAAARHRRADRMWARFIRLAKRGRHGRKPRTAEGIFRRLRMHLACGKAPGWYWLSILEYSDVADQKGPPLPYELRLRKPRPVQAMAGSRAKIVVLAVRAQTGQELWHVSDGPGVVARSEVGNPGVGV